MNNPYEFLSKCPDMDAFRSGISKRMSDLTPAILEYDSLTHASRRVEELHQEFPELKCPHQAELSLSLWGGVPEAELIVHCEDKTLTALLYRRGPKLKACVAYELAKRSDFTFQQVKQYLDMCEISWADYEKAMSAVTVDVNYTKRFAVSPYGCDLARTSGPTEEELLSKLNEEKPAAKTEDAAAPGVKFVKVTLVTDPDNKACADYPLGWHGEATQVILKLNGLNDVSNSEGDGGIHVTIIGDMVEVDCKAVDGSHNVTTTSVTNACIMWKEAPKWVRIIR